MNTNQIRLIVQRFELNDSTNPSFYIVGFKIISDINQRESYLETQVDFKESVDKSDNEICTIAYSQLKQKIDCVKTDLLRKKFIVGSEFVPPSI
jgi:predicted RNase H-like nuclease